MGFAVAATATALRDWLRTHPDLAGTCGGRVFAHVLPRGVVLPAMDLARVGGAMSEALDHPRYSFRCWGPAPESAEALAQALASLLWNVRGPVMIGTGQLRLLGAIPMGTVWAPEAPKGTARFVLTAELHLQGVLTP